MGPVASWRVSNSPYSGGTVPDLHRVPSPCSSDRGPSLSSDGVRVIRAPVAARRGLGRAHLRVLVGSGSRHRARRLGSRPAKTRPRGRVRGARCAARSRDRPSRTRVRARNALRGERRTAPGARSRSHRLAARRRDRYGRGRVRRSALAARGPNWGASLRDRGGGDRPGLRVGRHASALERLARFGVGALRRRRERVARRSRRGS